MNQLKNNDDSKVVLNSKGEAVAFIGPDATRYFQVATLRSALYLFSKGITPRRGITRRDVLKLASTYTGKPYTVKQLELARSDLKIWMDTMRAALPIETQKEAPHA